MWIKLSNWFKKLGRHYKFVPSYVMSHQSIAQFHKLSLLSSMSYQSRLIWTNFSVIALLIHTCVQLRQPNKLVETTQQWSRQEQWQTVKGWRKKRKRYVSSTEISRHLVDLSVLLIVMHLHTWMYTLTVYQHGSTIAGEVSIPRKHCPMNSATLSIVI